MTHKVLVIYPQKCTGCRICEQWCSWTHHGVVSPARSRIAIHRLHQHYVSVPVACSQCVRAPCIEICPEQAISRDPDSYALILDEEACLGCRLCVESCPRGCIKVDAEAGMPLLCDLCQGDPQCAKHCPEGAIRYLEPDRLDHGYREVHVARVAWGRDVL
jgi:carbon-monoxide dehydrogenase iron sulfur subunit